MPTGGSVWEGVSILAQYSAMLTAFAEWCLGQVYLHIIMKYDAVESEFLTFNFYMDTAYI